MFFAELRKGENMLENYNVSKDDVLALIEVLRSVKDRNLGYVAELEMLRENGFVSAITDIFGSLYSAKDYLLSHASDYPSNQGAISMLVEYLNRLTDCR